MGSVDVTPIYTVNHNSKKMLLKKEKQKEKEKEQEQEHGQGQEQEQEQEQELGQEQEQEKRIRKTLTIESILAQAVLQPSLSFDREAQFSIA